MRAKPGGTRPGRSVPARPASEPSRRGRRTDVIIGVIGALLALALPFMPVGAQTSTPVEVTPDQRLVEHVTVSATNPDGASTLQPLVPGQAYIFEVSGTVAWGPGQADAECATYDTDPAFLPDRFSNIHPHVLDVLVNGRGVRWTPTTSDADDCNTADHTYRYWYEAASAAPVNFRFHETPGYYPDNQGSFTVDVFRAEGLPPDGTQVDEFAVPANSQTGANSNVSLQPARRYRLAVSGVYQLQTNPEINHDAECVQVVATRLATVEVATPFSRQDELDDLNQMKDVYVNGVEVGWVPSSGLTGCDEKFHTYVYEFSPETAGPVNLRIQDLYYPDNQGSVTAKVFEIAEPPPEANSDGLPSFSDLSLVEEVTVPSNDPNGASTIQPLIPGETYIFEAVGAVDWGLGEADAECATFETDATFLPDRFSFLHPHMLDVLVDNLGVEWIPSDPDVNNCSSEAHTYRSWFRAATPARVNFRFHETPGYYPDNQGSFTVRVFFAEGIPPDGTKLDEFTVPANAPGGADSSVSLQPGTRYRIAVTGVYSLQTGPDINHDAECIQVAAGPFTRQDQLDDAGEMKDVYVNTREVDWVPSSGRTGCDEKLHTYLYEFSPEVAAPLNLRVRDLYYPDNRGSVIAQIFEIGPPGSPPLTKALTDTLGDPPGPGELALVEEVAVDSKNPNGGTTIQPLIPGERYTFEVSGTYEWGLGKADGECATLATESSESWLPDRFAYIDPHVFDVEVAGQSVDWEPTRPNPDGCNTDDHAYRVDYTPTQLGPVNFRVNERVGWYPDNQGTLRVRVFFAEGDPGEGTLVDQFAVSASNPQGTESAVSLQEGRAYRLVVSGVYRTQTGPDINHDAECISVDSAAYTRQDQLDDAGQMKDVYVNDAEVDWKASAGRTGCDEKLHTYLLDVAATVSGQVKLAVNDFYYPDNVGQVSVRIYDLGPA